MMLNSQHKVNRSSLYIEDYLEATFIEGPV